MQRKNAIINLLHPLSSLNDYCLNNLVAFVFVLIHSIPLLNHCEDNPRCHMILFVNMSM